MGGRWTGRSWAHPVHGLEYRIQDIGNRLVDVDGGMSLLGGQSIPDVLNAILDSVNRMSA